MERHGYPSFSRREWDVEGDPHEVPISPPGMDRIVVKLGSDAFDDVDKDRLDLRCNSLLSEVASALGVYSSGEISVECDQMAAVRISVEVDGCVRFVASPQSDVDFHITGWAIGLSEIEAVAIAALERVVLDDPSVLIRGDSWFFSWRGTGWEPDGHTIELLLQRHVPPVRHFLEDGILADKSDEQYYLAQITALLNDTTLTIELPEGSPSEEGDRVLAWVAAVLDDLRRFACTYKLSNQVGGINETRPWAQGWARLTLAGLPLLTFSLVEDLEPQTGILRTCLLRAQPRTIDAATIQPRLERLATVFPDTVTALRDWPGYTALAEVLRCLAGQVRLTGFYSIVAALAETRGLGLDDMLNYVRPAAVERLLQELNEEGYVVELLALTELDEQALAGQPDSKGRFSQAALAVSMRILLSLERRGGWNHLPAVIVVDDALARDLLRRLIRPQAPGVLVLRAIDVPLWLNLDAVVEL